MGEKLTSTQTRRLPLPLNPSNVVDHEIPPFYRTCEAFHEEATCARYRELNNEESNELGTNNVFGNM